MDAPALHILTCEFTPDRGGVAYYTWILAGELARQNRRVVIWTPDCGGTAPASNPPGIEVIRLPGGFLPRHLAAVDRALGAWPAPRQLLVQWVPHGYGLKSMNWFLCAWLWSRVQLHRDRLQVMVHEPCAPYRGLALKANVVALAHRAMLYTLLRGADRIWVSTPRWAELVRPYSRHAGAIRWLPIWSNIAPEPAQPERSAAIRARYCADASHLVGHFGTYSAELRRALDAILPQVLQRRGDVVFLLLGRGGEAFRSDFCRRHPQFVARVQATDHLPDSQLSLHLSACDLMLQPYTGGINVRHGSALAVISHGRPLVSNRGLITESLWDEPFGGVLRPAFDDARGFADSVMQLLQDQARRADLADAAVAFYERHFSAARSAAMLLA